MFYNWDKLGSDEYHHPEIRTNKQFVISIHPIQSDAVAAIRRFDSVTHIYTVNQPSPQLRFLTEQMGVRNRSLLILKNSNLNCTPYTFQVNKTLFAKI